MTPEQVVAEAEAGTLRPVYLLVGEERWLADRATAALRVAATAGGIAGFNEERFTAGESSIEEILAAANVLPMMAPRRFVLVRAAERWEKAASDEDDGKPKKGVRESPLDALDGYCKSPSPSTVLVVAATKLNGARRVAKTAKAGGFWVDCQPLKRRDLTTWIRAAARSRGHAIDEAVASRVGDLAGPELGAVDDAVERLSLWVGPGRPIDDAAVDAVVARVRESSVWELVDAIVARRLDLALTTLPDVVSTNDAALPALGAIATNVRQLLKMDAALRSGASVPEAAAAAGVPPFKAEERGRALSRLPPRALASWPRLLARADLECKGSKKGGVAVLEETIVAMCTAG